MIKTQFDTVLQEIRKFRDTEELASDADPDVVLALIIDAALGGEPLAVLRARSAIWQMNWSGISNSTGERLYPDKPDTEEMFEEEKALAILLANDTCFINSYHWKKDWPEAAQKATCVYVNCNDVFAWGCSDAEELPYDKIEEVYRYWLKDPANGAEIWCIIQREELPQGPVAKAIEKGGIWDLKALQKEHNLAPNYYDGASGVFAQLKRDTYITWMTLKGRVADILPFDGSWWAGWKEYTDAHPEWENADWKEREAAAKQKWLDESGWTAKIAEMKTEKED